jgi:transcriptional regulator with XRE-family HTH domain
MTGMEQSELHTRLIAAVDGRSYREIGDLTGVHPETVRRYMQGQAPSVDFLTNLCRALGLSGTWLLTGDGVMHVSETKRAALDEAEAPELFTAMAGTLGGLIDRVGRLEGYLQTLETRVRGSAVVMTKAVASGPTEEGHVQPADASRSGGARRIGAAARRPRADAD